jgi:hypothetical protein
LTSLVRDFRAGRREFFRTAKPGPKTAPAKERARPRVIDLRRAGLGGSPIDIPIALHIAQSAGSADLG